jgi:hypothetical protein
MVYIFIGMIIKVTFSNFISEKTDNAMEKKRENKTSNALQSTTQKTNHCAPRTPLELRNQLW